VSLLTFHLWVGAVVALAAIAGIWRTSDRRIALYIVTLQVLIGIVLVVQGLRAPSLHYALAILGFIGYMVANAMARRAAGRPIVLATAILSSVLLLVAFAVGHSAVQHAWVR